MAESTKTKTQATALHESTLDIPDESDQIIADLKEQLKNLRAQVVRNQQEKHLEDPASNAKIMLSKDVQVTELQLQLQIKKEQIHVLQLQKQTLADRMHAIPATLQRLQEPMNSMTQQLEQLMARIQDKDVIATLQQCKNFAQAVVNQTKKAAETHKWTELNLRPNKKTVEILSFFHNLVTEKKTAGQDVRFAPVEVLPEKIFVDEDLFKRAILIMLKEIQRLSPNDPIHVVLKQGDAMIYDVNIDLLKVALFGETHWTLPQNAKLKDMLNLGELSSDENGMDLINAKAVVEQHGGQFEFHFEQEKIIGFAFSIPIQKHNTL